MPAEALDALTLREEAPKGEKRVRVRFYYHDEYAAEVTVAGSFNDWHPSATPMLNIGHGRWTAYLFLPPGRYEYQFIVDGRWLHDRTCNELVDNPMGGLNSVLDVPGSETQATPAMSPRGRGKFAWEDN